MKTGSKPIKVSNLRDRIKPVLDIGIMKAYYWKPEEIGQAYNFLYNLAKQSRSITLVFRDLDRLERAGILDACINAEHLRIFTNEPIRALDREDAEVYLSKTPIKPNFAFFDNFLYLEDEETYSSGLIENPLFLSFRYKFKLSKIKRDSERIPRC
jgi:hypothetical protein